MYKDFKKKSFGGGSGRGGNRGGGFWKRDGGSDGGNGGMFRSTCAKCHESCEVPFKPNGRKPVLCSDCFSRTDEGAVKSRFGGERSRGDRFGSPRGGDGYGASRGGDRRPERSGGSDDVVKQLKSLNSKMDQILEVLQFIADEEVEGLEDEDYIAEDLGEEGETNEMEEDLEEEESEEEEEELDFE